MPVITKLVSTAALCALVCLLFSAAATPPVEANPEWFLIAQNSENNQIYSGKKGSFEITTTKSGVKVATILGQIEDKKEKTVTYGKWYVSVNDCDAGMGKIVVLKINGDYSFESDFVLKGKNIASGIADLICEVYQLDVNEKQGKGI